MNRRGFLGALAAAMGGCAVSALASAPPDDAKQRLAQRAAAENWYGPAWYGVDPYAHTHALRPGLVSHDHTHSIGAPPDWAIEMCRRGGMK